MIMTINFRTNFPIASHISRTWSTSNNSIHHLTLGTRITGIGTCLVTRIGFSIHRIATNAIPFESRRARLTIHSSMCINLTQTMIIYQGELTKQPLEDRKFQFVYTDTPPLTRFSNNALFKITRYNLVDPFIILLLNHSSNNAVFCLHCYFSTVSKTA